MLPWGVLFALLLVLHAALGLANHAFNPGNHSRRHRDTRLCRTRHGLCARKYHTFVFFFIQCVVFIVLLVELLFVDVYSSTFDVISYYINTRGYTYQDFWDQGSY